MALSSRGMTAPPLGLIPGAEKEEEEPRTRCGYKPVESIRSFEKAMAQSGAVATGRALHFAADVVCSGGLESFIKSLWEYAVCHIGIASPRAFVYLKKRTGELQDILKHLPDEQAYAREDFQIRIGELILVLREAPARPHVAWPKVGPETHDPSWIGAAGGAAPETAVLQRVWKQGGDAASMRTAGAEICKAVGDGSTEKALFWVKWLFEEEGRIRKEIKGGALTTVDRSGGMGGRGQKSGVGGYVLALYAEVYKELAAKGVVRMNEEFQTLLDLWRGGDKQVQGAAKRQILAVLTQILCEVPRWKVPAAPSLVKDPVAISTSIRQVGKFFREVLAYDPPAAGAAVVKGFKSRGRVDSRVVAKAKKGEAAEAQMSAFDRALEDYFARS